MSARPNTPTFDTFVKTPKTQDDIFKCVESGEMFVALIPFRYEHSLFSLCPAIVFSVKDHEYREKWLDGSCKESKDHFNFHAIALHIQDKRYAWTDELFICSEYSFQNETIAESIHPLPEWHSEFIESYINDVSVESSLLYSLKAIESWGRFTDNRMFWVWRALKAKEQLAVNIEKALRKEYEDARNYLARKELDNTPWTLIQ